MSLSSASSAIYRRSYLNWDESSFSSLDLQDTSSSHRSPSLRISRPSSSSSSRGSLRESAPRPRTTSYKESRKRRDSASLRSSNRMSFIDFGENTSSRLLGSLRGRMQRKRSAPLLGSTHQAIAPNDPSTSAVASFRPGPSRFPFGTARDDNDTSLNMMDMNPLLSFRDERKRTLMPDEIVDGVGYGIRQSRLSTVAESEAGEEFHGSEAEFRPLPLKKKDGTLLHSYPRSDAPYMRGYNKVDLQNDAYFHLLLRRLNTSGTPSFREYLCPPEDVLDLGCGQGTWVQEAAAAWPAAKIVGYDIVDLFNEPEKPHPNVTLKSGNFVAYRLPFDPGSFDLVRLANLTEAIPLHRWEHVLVEVRRVLKPAGRIEIIDDEISFPYPRLTHGGPSSGFLRRKGSRDVRNSWESNTSKLSSDVLDYSEQATDTSFLDLDAMMKRDSIGSAPGLCREDSPSEESIDSLRTPIDDLYGLATMLESKNLSACNDTSMPSIPLCQEIEEIYKRMLETIYDISTRPSDFLESLLRKVFGPAGKVSVLKDFQLSLLNPELHDLVVSSKNADSGMDSPKKSRKLFKAEKDGRRIDKNKEILDKVMVSQSKSKALRILGAGDPTPVWNPISTNASDDSDIIEEQAQASPTTRARASSAFSALAFPASSRPSTSSSVTSQVKSHNKPSGLFIFPDQFLETTSLELERHLCKHIDTLLGCRVALDEYVMSLRDENGEVIVQEDDWHDMLWEYERSRRERFGLPNVGGVLEDAEDEDEDVTNLLLKEPARHPRTVVQAVAAAINNGSCPRPSTADSSNHSKQPSTLIRRIRVFEAYKIKPTLPS
ncbi:hypothetical protein ACEPAH_859 [Sanghuangporus vaninii]